MFSPIGFPLEISIERLLIKLRLSALMANQLLIKNNYSISLRLKLT